MTYAETIHRIESIIEQALSAWPEEWQGFTWPGYTYEHTLRVRNLSLALARRFGADERVVELAALLHDIGKPAGEPHAEPSAQRAEPVLVELGVDAPTRQRVLHAIANHITCDPAHPVENLALYDADLIAANFGYIAFTRFITIRAHRSAPIPAMVTEGRDWLVRVQERSQKLTNPLSVPVFEARYAKMQRFYQQLAADLETGAGPALALARFLEADAARPSLARQMSLMQQAQDGVPGDGLTPSPFLAEALTTLRAEIAGEA